MTQRLTGLVFICLAVVVGGCDASKRKPDPEEPYDPYALERRRMIDRHIRARGISTPHVIDAMENTPREKFVPAGLQAQAFEDSPLPIGEDQTISQPYIVAFMTDQLKLSGQKTERCLEIGTGSGYQAAVLSHLCQDVFTIEIVPSLAESAHARLKKLGYANVHVKTGDGYKGWPEHAPFDAVIVTAAADHIPQPLIDQLARRGRMIMPVGGKWTQELIVVRRTIDGMVRERTIPVRFVPLTGDAVEAHTQ